METSQNRRRKFCVFVSHEAYKALQDEAFRIDRHATRVAEEIIESAFLALNYRDPNVDITRSESPSGSTEEAVS
jgi:hypothetical protein